MNPIIEEWFVELDEGVDNDLRGFVRKVSDAVISEVGARPDLVKYLEDRGLALVPVSRLWWENPKSQMFSPVRHREEVPGHSPLPGSGDEVEEAEDVPLPDFIGRNVRGSFVEGALEGIVTGQKVNYQTAPSGPMNQSDFGTGFVTDIHGMSLTVVVNSLGDFVTVDLDRGGRVVLQR